jgi:hypothetical protein
MSKENESVKGMFLIWKKQVDFYTLTHGDETDVKYLYQDAAYPL